MFPTLGSLVTNQYHCQNMKWDLEDPDLYPTENVIKLKCQSEITNTSKGIQELGRHISKTTTTVFL